MLANNKKVNILYVDDEEFNLRSFKATFRRDYNIFTAISAEDAFKVLEENSIAVILSDQRMPGMTGVEFFEELLEKHPDSVRILVTAYTDVEAVIDAINKGKVYRYLKKPWDDYEMQVTINNAYNFYATKDALKKKNDELNRFVYSASHDLRSPLMSIEGVLQLAKLEDDPAKFKEYLEMIESSVVRMDRFTQNIIEYYQNERIDDRVEEVVNFESLVNDITAQLKIQFPETNLNVNIVQNEDFVNDTFRVKVVLENIISNAFQFTKSDNEPNTVNIDVVVEDDLATVTIEDNGIGIDHENLSKVFNMFYKGIHPNSGSGIGLFIAHEALDKINGACKIESDKALGTKFTVSLPSKKNG